MNIQHLRDFKNHFINMHLDKNSIDEPLAKEIVDFYLQPLPVNIHMYSLMMKQPQAETDNRLNVLTGVLENMISGDNIQQYSEPYPESMDAVRTYDIFKALSLKYGNLSKLQFDSELELLSRKQSNSDFIDNHYKQIHFTAAKVYEWKFGVEPNITPVKSSYEGRIEFDEYSAYLKDFIANKTTSLYSADEIKQLIRQNSQEKDVTDSLVFYHKNVLSSKTSRDSQRHNSKNFLKNVSFKELTLEGNAYQSALFLKESENNDMELINAINNPTINKVISEMRDRGEFRPSHLKMVIDAYSGNEDPNTLIESYRNEFNKPSEDPAYFKNGIKLLLAVINDPNKASLDPNVNPYLIIEGKTIESLSTSALISKQMDIIHNAPENNRLVDSVYNMVLAERENRNENTLAHIVVKHMSNEDAENAIKSLNSKVISDTLTSSSLNVEDKKDIIRAVFALHHEYDRLSDKHSLALPENTDHAKHHSLSTLFSIMKIDITGSRTKNMEDILTSFVNNNTEEKVETVYNEISAMKDQNKLSRLALASIDKNMLEKAAPLEDTLISRLRRKFF